MIHPTAVIGCQPMQSKAFARPVARGNKLPVYGFDFSAGPFAVVLDDTEFGNGCVVGAHAMVREGTTMGDYCVVGAYSDVSHSCTFGDSVRINDHCFIPGRTVIGDDVFIGPRVVMGNDRQMVGDWRDDFKGPFIQTGARIGMGAIIFPGVTIGRGAIIGAGAKVRRDVPEGVTVVGDYA